MQNRLAKLALVLGRDCAQQELSWMKHANQPLSDMLDRRIAGEPLQYILGSTPFGPLDLLTRPPTLIPRPETEHWAIRLAHARTPDPARPVRVLDLCTGSGCIPLLLCHLWPPGSTRAVGVDISPDAVRLSTDNAARSRITTNARQIRPDENVFTPLLGDIRDPLLLRRLDPPPPFDVITANPPYVPLHVYHTLPSSVKDYEDPRALIGDPPDAPHQDGLSFYRTIAVLLARKRVLAPHALVALEVGHDQAHAVTRILAHTPGLRLAQMEIWKDPWDKDRVVFARAA
ncbi:S-adenosyl-L-methionine-dependent methyltransferase [Boletus coccyginus]|nr:S-adenosyl-L-methionine-dependent methyltransferase [Boletus coccyginus]